jgi:hypothetical protein
MFLGYSLSDVNFRVILRGLVGSLSPSLRQMGLSVQYCSGQPGDLEKYIEDYFGHTLKLHVFWYSARDFCHEMNEKLSAVLWPGERRGAADRSSAHLPGCSPLCAIGRGEDIAD